MVTDRPKTPLPLQPEQPPLNPVLKGFTIQLRDSIPEQTPSLREKIGHKVLEVLQQHLVAELSQPIIENQLIQIWILSEVQPQTAWGLVYQLYQNLDGLGVIYVEPLFALLVNPNTIGCPPGCPTDFGIRTYPDGTKPSDWHLKALNLDLEWLKHQFQSKGKEPGEDVVIGHPDTGHLPHAELPENLRDRLHDQHELVFWDGPNSGENTLPSPDSPAYWHGTATASLMVSPEGSPQDLAHAKDSKPYVTGVAPGATLLPLALRSRSIEFQLYTTSLAQAIFYAASDDPDRSGQPRADVLSISMGGYPSLTVHRAIIHALQRGIIVVASAGNTIPFATWPAAYHKVIAVAASTVEGKRASFSAWGSRVDVAAPGEGIWCAIVQGKNQSIVQQRSGTSYSAPLVAGLAALWRSYHTQETLLEKYHDPERIPLVFKYLLRNTCQPWDEINCGAGIVDAKALLEAPLPDIHEVMLQMPQAYQEIDHVELDRGGVTTFCHLFESVLCSPLQARRIADHLEHHSTFAQEMALLKLNFMEWILLKLLIPTQIPLEKARRQLRPILQAFGRELTFHFGIDRLLYAQLQCAMQSKTLGTLFHRLKQVRQALCQSASPTLREVIQQPSR